ncbi:MULTISPECIES: IclR family transcriptional regulator C-terminal domain-containing protein [unclassified Microbacterium]|uniref:IclR family transcriptional regulator domain-containing protein n=1 Tax=unclassified Microbacterium TaxID=2609290 RepID=UPI0015A4CA68|nr:MULTISPECIES: IclR family transcriptional regulator C-terminal domain-containing protein [unclassified Microbacterium]
MRVLRGLAVPVRGRDGSVAAAVNVSMSSGRHSRETVVERFVPSMMREAAAMQADLRLL